MEIQALYVEVVMISTLDVLAVLRKKDVLCALIQRTLLRLQEDASRHQKRH